jgi:hypothetical protein
LRNARIVSRGQSVRSRADSAQIARSSVLIKHTGSCEARDLPYAPNACELSMTHNDPPLEDDVPMDSRVAAYEARLTRLERELPSFERELRRVGAKSAGATLADCVLS